MLLPWLTAVGGTGLLSSLAAPNALASTGPLDAAQRSHRAFVIRRDAAILQRDHPETPSIGNGDEELYPSRIASYSKGLPHNDLGEVDPNAYSAYLQALTSGLKSDFEAIPPWGTRRSGKSAGAYCFTLEGADAYALAIPAAPAFSSARMAADIGEDYWCALTRDVPFSQYAIRPHGSLGGC